MPAQNPVDLPVRFVDEVTTAIDALAANVLDIAATFRRFELAPAFERLPGLAADFERFAAVVNAIDGHPAIDSASLVVDDLTPQEQIARLGQWFDVVVEAQQNIDATLLADILEYDLEPFLRAWQKALVAQVGTV